MLKIFITTYLFQVDIVLIALFLACIDILFNGLFRFRFPDVNYILGLVIIVIFYFYLIISLLYTPSDEYAFVKTVNFIPNLIFFLYAGFIKKIDFNIIVKLYCIVVIPVAAFFVYMKSLVWWTIVSDSTRTFMEIRNHYLSVGLHLGILFFLSFHHYRKMWLLLLTIFLLFASSARGALLFTVLVFVFFEFTFIKKIAIRKSRFIAGTFITCIALIAGFVYKDTIYRLTANTINRLLVLLGGQGSSTRERIEGMTFAFDESFSSFPSFFWGHGIGSFGINYAGKDTRLYPHNMILEVLYELGLFGVVMIFIFLALGTIKAIKGHKTILILLIFCLLNAMKSSNLTDLWILFGTVGLALNQRKLSIND